MAAETITPKDLARAVPNTSETVNLKGMGASAEVYRDVYGIPHVRAGSTWDAFLAQGFVTAQDRLWHMDYDRHRAYGKWAEYTGPAGLDQDTMMRRFRLEASARTDYQAVGEEARMVLDAYAAGVNAFIGTTHTPAHRVQHRGRPASALAAMGQPGHLQGTSYPDGRI